MLYIFYQAYLFFYFDKRNTVKTQIQNLVRKRNKIIGKTVWEREFGKKVMLFKSLVESVVVYGAEIKK